MSRQDPMVLSIDQSGRLYYLVNFELYDAQTLDPITKEITVKQLIEINPEEYESSPVFIISASSAIGEAGWAILTTQRNQIFFKQIMGVGLTQPIWKVQPFSVQEQPRFDPIVLIALEKLKNNGQTLNNLTPEFMEEVSQNYLNMIDSEAEPRDYLIHYQ